MEQKSSTEILWVNKLRARHRDLEELLTLDKQVEALLAHPGWEWLQSVLAEREARLVEDLSKRTVWPHEEYVAIANSLRSIGEVRAIPAALREVAAEAVEREQRLIEAQQQGAAGVQEAGRG